MAPSVAIPTVIMMGLGGWPFFNIVIEKYKAVNGTALLNDVYIGMFMPIRALSEKTECIQ